MKMTVSVRLVLLLAGVLLLASCGSSPGRPGGPEIIDARPDGGANRTDGGSDTLELPARKEQALEYNSAVDGLLTSAAEAMARGELARAAATIERAIRLAPDDARGYFSLAQLRFRQQQLNQVTHLIDKATVLASGDRELLHAIEQFSQRVDGLQ